METKPDYGKIVTVVLFGTAILAGGYFVMTNLDSGTEKPKRKKK